MSYIDIAIVAAVILAFLCVERVGRRMGRKSGRPVDLAARWREEDKLRPPGRDLSLPERIVGVAGVLFAAFILAEKGAEWFHNLDIALYWAITYIVDDNTLAVIAHMDSEAGIVFLYGLMALGGFGLAAIFALTGAFMALTGEWPYEPEAADG